MAAAFRDSVVLLDRVFVRDAQSMRFVEAAAPEMAKVRRAPDFTNLLHPALANAHRAMAGRSLVIPNEKMVGTDADRRARYVRLMAKAARAIAASGREVAILIHEGEKDRALATEINAALDSPVPVIDAPTALQTKAIIAAADLIVSSRFHGLVSALSNAVPALACGWSHKYAELMNDYGAPDLLVSLDDEASWEQNLARLLEAASDTGFREALAHAAEAQKAASRAMWEDVVTLIRTGCAGAGSSIRQEREIGMR